MPNSDDAPKDCYREALAVGAEMRALQCQYFKSRDPDVLRDAKRKEREFDSLCKTLLSQQERLSL